MRTAFRTALLVGALGALPVAGFGATPAVRQAPAATKQASARTPSTHATRGVVKSVDASTLVITRAGGNHADMTFALNAATHREGTIAVGAPVSVRYREDGKANVATAVGVQAVKHPAAHGMPSKR